MKYYFRQCCNNVNTDDGQNYQLKKNDRGQKNSNLPENIKMNFTLYNLPRFYGCS